MAHVGGGARVSFGWVTGAVRGVEPAVEGVMSDAGGAQSALSEVIPVVRGAQPAVWRGHAG